MMAEAESPNGAIGSRGGQPPRFRRDIEGLRGLAILLVIAYHAGIPGFSGGYIGVDVFFVLSGYLITGLLITEIRSTGRLDFRAFYARRARRLLPAACTVIIATLLIGRIIYAPVDHRELANTGIATALYASNLYFTRSAIDYLADPGGNPLLHTWSLAVEEQFYLFWPAIVLACLAGFRARIRLGRLFAGMTVIAVGSYALCVWMTGVMQPFAFFLLPTRAWEFAIGALACMAPMRHRADSPVIHGAAWIGMIAVIAAGMLFGAETVFPGSLAMIPVAGTGLMLAAGAVNGQAGPLRLLVNRPIQWIGRVSYGWYLWHWPILIYAHVFPSLRGIWPSIAMSAVALVLAGLMLVFIENPIRFHRRLAKRPMLSLGVAAAMTLLAVSAAVATRIIGTMQAASPGQALYDEARDLPVIYADGCHVNQTDTKLQPCEYGDVSAASSIVLFGDSHAAQWFPPLEDLALSHHLKLVSLTKSSCPAASVDLENSQLGRLYTECSTWREAAIQRILELKPVAVVISNYAGYIALPGTNRRWTTSLEDWRNGVQRTVGAFDSAGIQTILLAETPVPGFDVPSCLARAAWNPRLYRNRCEFDRTWEGAAVSNRIDAEIAGSGRRVRVVDLTDAICGRNRCSAEADGLVLYRDSRHLTTRFAASLAGILSERILPASTQ